MQGSGTLLDPYQVATAEDLYNVRNDLSAYYLQTADIDLSGYANWEPIGVEAAPFAGSYNGGNYKITNLTINAGGTDRCMGLFGYSINGHGDDAISFQNIFLENVSISAVNNSYGALAGYHCKGNISNCHSSGNIDSLGDTYALGGLIGYVEADYYDDEEISILLIAGCSSSVDITARFDGYPNYSFCSVAGGLIGCCDRYTGIVNITSCMASGEITHIPDTVRKVGLTSAAGFVGEVYSGSIIINQCLSTGNVSTGWSNGGFCGFTRDAIIQDCYCAGSILVPDGYEGYTGYNDNGGFAGEAGDSSFTNCYSAGQLEGLTWDEEYSMAGFCPFSEGRATITNCYYDSTLCSRTDQLATPKTTEEMALQETFVGWDFESIWVMAGGYPQLKWALDSFPLQTGKDYALISPSPVGTMTYNGQKYEFVRFLERFPKVQHEIAGVSATYEYGGPVVIYEEQPYHYLASGITDPEGPGGFGSYLPDTSRTVISLADRESFVNFYYTLPRLAQVAKPKWVKKVLTWQDIPIAAAYKVILYNEKLEALDSQVIAAGIQRCDFTDLIENYLPAGSYYATVQALEVAP